MALELDSPGQRPIVVATLGEGDIRDGSWLVPPYRWTLDAHASALVRVLGVMPDACARNARPITILATS